MPAYWRSHCRTPPPAKSARKTCANCTGTFNSRIDACNSATNGWRLAGSGQPGLTSPAPEQSTNTTILTMERCPVRYQHLVLPLSLAVSLAAGSLSLPLQAATPAAASTHKAHQDESAFRAL